MRRTFEPLIADWQREWQDAPPAQRWLVSLRGMRAFVLAVMVSSPQIILTSAPPGVTNRVASRMTRVIAILTLVLMIPPVLSLWYRWVGGATWMSGPLFFFAVPSALALAFPFAMASAVDAIRSHERLSAPVERAAALKLGAFAALFMFVYAGWVIPASNHASRQVMNPPNMSAPLRGMAELSTRELIFDPARATVFAPGTYLASRSASIQRELNGRAAMVALPLALLWLRWRAYNDPLRRRFTPLPAWLAIVFAIAAMSAAQNAGTWLEREWQLWDGSRNWLPIIVFAIWGVVSSYGRRLLPARA